jgi:hypothetical protein
MRILGQTRSFRSLITEPEPGRVLLETDLSSGVATRFDFMPLDNDQHSRVMITTELENVGTVEGVVAKLMLQKIYRQELALLARFAEGNATFIQSASTSSK